MAPRYFPVSPAFWNDAKVRTWNDSQQKLALYLLTCDHRNLEGLYKLPVSYIADDTGWSEAKAQKYLDALIAEGFCEYDHEARVILVANALDYYKPHTIPQLKGAAADLELVPASPLKDRFVSLAEQKAKRLWVLLTMGIDEAVAQIRAERENDE